MDVYISAGMLNMAKKQGFNVLAQIRLLPLGAVGGAIGVALRFGLARPPARDLLRGAYSTSKVVSINHGHINKENTFSVV